MGSAWVKEGSVLPMTLEPTRRRGSNTDDASVSVRDGSHPLLGGAQEIPRTLVWEAYVY